ncbi:MAG: pitrilysin family protein [Acidobacteriota bacterium]
MIRTLRALLTTTTAIALAAGLMTSTLHAQVETADQLVYPPLPAFTLPTPDTTVLDNGMTVMVQPDRALPLARVILIVRAGARWETDADRGVAGLAGQVMRTGGTADLSSAELDVLLDGKAARLEVGIGLNEGVVSFESLAEDFTALLPVLADVVRRPAFAPDALEVARQQTAAGIVRRSDAPSSVRSRVFRKLVFGADSAFGRELSLEQLQAISRDDLVDWHARWIQPERIILGVSGDVDAAEALRAVRAAFGDWPRGPAFEMPDFSWRETPRPGLFFIEHEDIDQAYIRIGHLGLRIDHPDYYATEVLNQLFGAGLSSRLFSVVRSQKGLAYSVYGSISANWDHPGVASLSIGTKPESTAEAIRALHDEVARLRTEPPSAEEIALAKSAILNSFVFSNDSPSDVLSQQMTFRYHGAPADTLARYRAGVEAVTAADIARAVAHFRPDEFSQLVVGPPEVDLDTLTAFAPDGAIVRLDADGAVIEPASPSETPAAADAAASSVP